MQVIVGEARPNSPTHQFNKSQMILLSPQLYLLTILIMSRLISSEPLWGNGEGSNLFQIRRRAPWLKLIVALALCTLVPFSEALQLVDQVAQRGHPHVVSEIPVKDFPSHSKAIEIGAAWTP